MTIVNARRLIRRMRGGAQAHTLEADDGSAYVVKFRNNPQHRRILVNEFIGFTIMRRLGIATPEIAIVNVSEAFLADHPELRMNSEEKGPSAVEPGGHFGSRHPGDPNVIPVYDLLPDDLFPAVINKWDFRAALVFDKWMANADARQCIFFRSSDPAHASASKTRPFMAQMMDNGYIFNGANWNFPESALQGLYCRRVVYGGAGCMDDFEPWLTDVVNFPEHVLQDALDQVPSPWIDGDKGDLERLLARLYERRVRVPDLLGATLATPSFRASRMPLQSGFGNRGGLNRAGRSRRAFQLREAATAV